MVAVTVGVATEPPSTARRSRAPVPVRLTSASQIVLGGETAGEKLTIASLVAL